MRQGGGFAKFLAFFLSIFYPQLSTIFSVEIVDNYVYNLKSVDLYEFLGFLRIVHSEIVSQSVSAHYTAYPIVLGANSSPFVGSGPKIEGEWDYC